MIRRISQQIEKRVSGSLESIVKNSFLNNVSPFQRQIEEQLQRIHSQMSTERNENKIITGASTIEEALSSHSRAHEILASVQLSSCQNCSVRFDETISEAAEFYEFSLETVLIQFNRLRDSS